MMATEIKTFREWNGEYQLVGYLVLDQQKNKFRYDEAYISSAESVPISESLPFPTFPSPNIFPGSKTYLEDYEQATCFFEGLLPEEGMRKEYEHKFHSSADTLIARLNNESVGALVFGEDPEEMWKSRSYEALSEESLKSFSKNPKGIAVQFGSKSRLSLSGAQSKIGLHRTKDTNGLIKWLLPKGSAPSTFIVKAGSIIEEGLPNSILNEAFCMKLAEKCGFEVAKTELLDFKETDPILAVKRFDREIGESDFPIRLHQEDFCQAKGFPPEWKYEPTDGNYINLGANLIDAISVEPFEDRLLFFQEVIFDFLIGNCDNHLKNYSFLWSSDWSTRRLSPVYDVTCTTIYSFDREMGISLCPSRKIDDITTRDIECSAKQAGIPSKLAWGLFDDLVDSFKGEWNSALNDLAEQCRCKKTIDDLEITSNLIWEDSQKRLNLRRVF